MNWRTVLNLTNRCARNFHTTSKQFAGDTSRFQFKSRTTLNYLTALGVAAVGASYAAVPLYRIFCQSTSYGGTTKHDLEGKIENIKPVTDRKIRVHFNADKSSALAWNFQPQQMNVTVVPGETALIFYTAQNPTDKPIIGVSSYNVIPFEAGQYFNKIQCFCFEEQMLNPHEEVDMPVFFYIDPEFVDDPYMEDVNDMVLSYTFFEAHEGMQIPVPSYVKKHAEKKT